MRPKTPSRRVVNIVNTQEISSRAGYRGGYGDDGGFEQFFDLFGIPKASTGNSRSNSRGRRSAKAADRASSSVRTAIS